MKITLICLTAVLWANAGVANVGHLADVAGHGHWIGAAALGAAIELGAWATSKGKSDEASDEDDVEPDEELQEA